MKTLSILLTIVTGTLCADLCKLKDQGIIQIPENTTVGTVVGLVDVVGSNLEVTLEPIVNANFKFNVSTREITLTAALDFENEKIFRYTVKCRQQNPSIQVNLFRMIALTDINDNTPVFTSSHYYVNVSEATKVNSIIFSGVTATDADETNLYMQYDVVKAGPYHSYIDFERASQGVVTLKKQLDYETLQEFTVEILVLDTPQDASSPRRSAIANLTVMVLNEDDMDPAFSRDHYEARISTSTPVGSPISTKPDIKAEDQDLHFKSQVNYSIWEYSDAFKMDPATAEIWLQKPLEGGRYTAVLKAAQTDNPARRTVSTLTVQVSGGPVTYKNRPPIFIERVFDVQVFENTPVNQIIASVPAIDPEYGEKLTYQLINNQSGMFEITPKAELKLLQPLDFETTQNYVLEISVADDENYNASATVRVHVKDVNDNNPVIVNSDIQVLAVREPNSLIATVEASDKDQSSRLSYSLIGGDSLFTVNDNGEVYTRGQAEDFTLNKYSFVVIVRDNGEPPRQASAHLMVRLPYINTTKIPPIFTESSTNSTDAPTNAAVKEEANEAVPIVLGILAAILLFVVIVLAILLIRRKKRPGSNPPQIENETESNNRRAFQDENLEKVKQPSHIDPEGLAYRPTGKPANGFPSTLDLSLDPQHGETEDGATTTQDNPISGINHAYSASDVSEVGNDMGDIRIQTSMTPYSNNGYPGYVENDLYGAGNMKTFRHSGSSNESLSSDSTPGSKKQLVKPDLMEHGKQNSRPFSWNNLNGSTTANSNGDISSDGRLSADEKPEITVYF